MANQYSTYFYLGALSIAAITQFLAIFGIANEINLMVWMYGLEGIGGLVSVATSVMLFLAYNDAYIVSSDESSSADDVTKATAVMDGVWNDWIKGIVDSILTEGVIMAKAEPWYRYNMKMAGKGKEMKDGEMMKEGEMKEGEGE